VLVGWLQCWLVGWLVGWLVAVLVGWLVGWLVAQNTTTCLLAQGVCVVVCVVVCGWRVFVVWQLNAAVFVHTLWLNEATYQQTGFTRVSGVFFYVGYCVCGCGHSLVRSSFFLYFSHCPAKINSKKFHSPVLRSNLHVLYR